MGTKPWGGRFSEEPDELAVEFSASVDVDRRLADQDIRGSVAHVTMRANRGIISKDDAEAIRRGLDKVRMDIEAAKFEWDSALEDVHMNIESALTAHAGEVGGRLHTARSRNDQVCTDMRLWTREACERTIGRIDEFSRVLVTCAEGHVDVLLPGYTHLQRAQPVRLAHHLLAWAEMLERDRGRLVDAKRRLNESPLGADALATTTFPIDRDETARVLGFDRPTANSLDTVADRDFLVEVLAALANCAVHLSRISEELVLWSSQEFGFLRMSDAFTTGSSMMPQKKNPDMAELVRGKSARVVGSLVSMLVLLKGLPLTYNRDLQEDKEPVFDAFDTVDASLRILAGAIGTATFDGDRMREALRHGFVEATEVADWLTMKGVPFRDAHHVAGRLVALCVEKDKVLSDLTLAEFQSVHPAFDESVFASLDHETAVERRDVFGGPARSRVIGALDVWKTRLAGRS
ncbi:MAG: argininosuccinate lyase [Myxococcales bacterium]|nr:argininosuccinate lyase [Myxococcales bacterium]